MNRIRAQTESSLMRPVANGVIGFTFVSKLVDVLIQLLLAYNSNCAVVHFTQ